VSMNQQPNQISLLHRLYFNRSLCAFPPPIRKNLVRKAFWFPRVGLPAFRLSFESHFAETNNLEDASETVPLRYRRACRASVIASRSS
jgi:hypothetical protein